MFTRTMRQGSLAALGLIAAASLISAAPASAATANNGRGDHHARFAQLYIFKGTVAVAPAAGATTLQISVTGGDRPALRALVGNTVSPLSFTVDARTSYIAWTASERGNGPSATTEEALKVGDPVHLRILSNRRAPLAQLLATPVRMVNDFAAAQSTTGRLFLFQGRAVGVDTTAKTITIDVQRGNWFALNAMLGQPTLETFHYDSATLFISWHRRTPQSFDPSAIKVGDPIMLKTRGVWNTPLATLLAAPLWKVNDHAPASAANSSGGNMPLES